MQFVVIAYDFTDDGAFDRRMAVRESHLKDAIEYYKKGQWLYAAGILDDNGKMIGSMIVCDFESKDELNTMWLKNEPYVQGNVWEKIAIHPAMVPPFCLKE